MTKIYHGDKIGDYRILGDANHSGRGATLNQDLKSELWVPIAFASWFLNAQEENYGTNEIKLFAVF